MALIDKKLTDLTEKLSVPDDAFIHIVDVSDTSQSPAGSSYKARKSTISGTVKAQTGVSGTVKTNTNSADPIVYLTSEVDALVAGKQDELGFTPENVANKQTNLDEDLSGNKYPNVTAVRNGLSDKASLADLFLKADKSSTYTKAEVDNIISSLEFQDVIEADSFPLLPLIGESEKIYITLDTNLLYRFDGTIYVPLSADVSGKEDIANKQNSLAVDATNLKYPTVTAVNAGLATKVSSTATTNFIPKVNAGGNLENSRIFDNGTNFGFGTETPVANASATMDGSAAISLILRDSGGTGSGFVAQNNTQIANNERLGYALFGGLDNSNNSVFASGISSNASTAWTPTSRPANLMFETTNITGARAVRGQFNARGAFLVNIIADNGLDIAQFNGTISVATATQPNQAPRFEQVVNTSTTQSGITGLKTFISDNTTLGGISVGNSRTGGIGLNVSSSIGRGVNVDASGGVGARFYAGTTATEALVVTKSDATTGILLQDLAGTDTGDFIKVNGQNTGGLFTFLNRFGVASARAGTSNENLATLGQIKSRDGWASYSTTTFTNASPFTVAPNTTVTLPNNANNSITTDLPLGVTAFYNGTTNKITPAAIGDAYTVNVRFKARTTMNNDYLTLFIDIGNGSQINAEAKQFLKGANTEQPFSFTMPIFTLATFVANGGEIKVASNGGTISIYDVTFYINRNYTR